MHILIYITSEEGCGKGFPQHQRTWKILQCINDCLFSPAKNQTEISSRTHREWDRAGRSDRFQHHTQSAIFYYWMWVCNTMTLFSTAVLSCSPYPHFKTLTYVHKHTHQNLFLSTEHFCSIWETAAEKALTHIRSFTVMYADTRLRTTQRINKECLHIHSLRLKQHKAPSFTQTALGAR